MDLFDEKVKLAWVSEELEGLSCLVESFKVNSLEDCNPSKTEAETRKDTRLILQTIISSLHGIANEVGQISNSIDEKEFRTQAVA